MSVPASLTKPHFEWTDEQFRAIRYREGSLAVSASAGSGKTAVLTERVFRLITEPGDDGETPSTSLERMLIITFTEKAASEMRERIERRIRAELLEDPDNRRLAEALNALGASWIMTIDAFCRRVVTENFHLAGVSPSPYVPAGSELLQLERTIIEGALERWTQETERGEQLARLLRCGRTGTDGVIETVRELLRFLDSLDQPERWIREVREKLEVTQAASSFEQLPEAYQAAGPFRRATLELAAGLEELIDLAETAEGDLQILDQWRGYADQLKALADIGSLFTPDAIQADETLINTLSKLSNKCNCGASLYANKAFNSNFLKTFEKHAERWQKAWLGVNNATYVEGARWAAWRGLLLLDLTENVRRKLGEEKQRRGWASFSDIQRLALKVLSDVETAGAPSQVAYEFRNRFDYVLVDEYQDTSPLQDAIVRQVTRCEDQYAPGAEEGNLFLVGDYKQSIYGFRHADPSLFLAIIHPAEETEATLRCEHFNLRENFRSRPGILEFANRCFERLMDRELGGLDYTEIEQLAAKREDPEGEQPGCVEVHWLPKKDDRANHGDPETDGDEGGLEALSGKEAQAAWVARHIREMTDPQTGVRIPEDGAMRRAQPGDCAILLRGLRNELDVWITALEAEGLKVRAPGINPLLTAPELIDLMAALRLADNPLQDIPLATVMRSPLGGFDENDLLQLRMSLPGTPFHHTVWAAAGRPLAWEDGEALRPIDESLKRRVDAFIEQLDRWRRLAERQSPEMLLDRILGDTQYEAWLSGLPEGPGSLANLDFLRQLLATYGRSEGGGNALAAFLETFDQAMDDAEAIGQLPESIEAPTDTVTLLTIHRSKGLEFPIVILPRMERRISNPKTGEILFDRVGGMALEGTDPDRQRSYPTLAHQVLTDEAKRRERAEELRLLYVAMTRARERLVLVGQVANLEKIPLRWGSVSALGGRGMGVLDRLNAWTLADLVGPIVEWLAENPEQHPWLRVERHEELPAIGGEAEDRVLIQALTHGGKHPERDWAEAIEQLASADCEREAPELRLVPRIDPNGPLTTLAMKTTVTQLRRRGESEGGEPRQEDLSAASEEESIVSEAVDEAARVELYTEEAMRAPGFVREGRLDSRRPRWDKRVGKKGELIASRRGSLTHEVMARIDLRGEVDADGLRRQAERLAEGKLLGLEGEDGLAPNELLESLDWAAMAWFFASDVGRFLLERPGAVSRELPFTARLPIERFDAAIGRDFPREAMTLQGIIDVVIDEGDTATLLDYKTDRVRDEAHLDVLARHYRRQIEIYGTILKSIWGLENCDSALVFLDARTYRWLDEIE